MERHGRYRPKVVWRYFVLQNLALLVAAGLLLAGCNRTKSVAPSDIGVAVTATAAVLTWQDNSDSETGFAVDRRLEAETDFIKLALLGPNTTTYTDTTVVLEQTYVYRVRVLGVAGGEVSSGETEPVTPTPSTDVATLEILFAPDSTGSGGVSSVPAGITCTLTTGSVCQATFPLGNTLTLTASAAELSTFAGWSQGCEGNSLSCDVQLTENKIVMVRFVPALNTLTVQKAGDGAGRITSGNPPDIDCGEKCVASYEVETTFRLSAQPEVGSSFAGWSENCKLLGARCEITIGKGKGVTVTATFSKIPPPVIKTFTATPTTAPVGTSIVFDWNVTGEGVSSLVLKDDKPATADLLVTGLTTYTLANVQETANYTLVATNAFGGSTASQPVKVTVGTPPTLSGLVATANPDKTFTLTWTITGTAPIVYKLIDVATGAELTPTSSPFTVSPSAFPATYQLEASSVFGVAAPQTVTLEAPVDARVLDFKAAPTFLIQPDNTTLTWSVEGSEPVTLSIIRYDTGEVIPVTGLTGSLELAVTRDTEFTLRAQNLFGTDERKERVRVRFDE
jgi:hypothetical protein